LGGSGGAAPTPTTVNVLQVVAPRKPISFSVVGNLQINWKRQ
jgi:hypothetical protein